MMIMIVDGKIVTFQVQSWKPSRVLSFFCLTSITLLSLACGQLKRPTSEPFYAQSAPPPLQEFRWSNGRSPKSLDPGRAASPPETDIVRAIYEGLTDVDPKTLKEVPGVAEKWESSEDLRVWTFHLRKDCRWTNGETVVSNDFVRSWKRLIQLKEKAANKYLLNNIVGMRHALDVQEIQPSEPADFLHETPAQPRTPTQKMQMGANPVPIAAPPATTETSSSKPSETNRTGSPKFGAEAVDDRTLRVTLELPDKDLPKLVANTLFRPVYGDGLEFNGPGIDEGIITNGAFRIAAVDDSGISLERSDNYWNRKSVALERVRFVSADTAERALDAYKSGNIDAITNADFEPLALKLLTPFEDFRSSTHSALNVYEINSKIAPFIDRRVRVALAISIDRDRLSEGELEGSTQPAYSFLPLGEANKSALSLDIERAKDLLAKAGYPNGENFPQIRLVVNRNDTQLRVAKTVAKMWRENLNLETQLIVKESVEMEKTRIAGDFNLIRRGVVMPTTDVLVSLTSLFASNRASYEAANNAKPPANIDAGHDEEIGPSPPSPDLGSEKNKALTRGPSSAVEPVSFLSLSEEDSLYNLYAIPLYFPTSYALVKPYVRGFDVNGLDAPSLKDVTIDNGWQPKRSSLESN